MVSVVRQADLIWLPWKNGAGEMADAAMSTERTPSNDPAWRVSMARVERDSPFSRFEGIERGMMLIEGDRLELNIEHDAPLIVSAAGSAVTFSGERATRGVPVDGPITNLNVMVSRSARRQRMIRWQCQGTAWLPVAAGGMTFAYVQRGEIAVQGERVTLNAGDTLITDAAVQIEGTAELIEISIWPS